MAEPLVGGEERMIELFVVEYMTVLGMIMVLLFLDSRYSRRCTILTVCGTMVLIMGLVAVMYQMVGIKITIQIYSLIAHVPSLLLLLLLSRFRGWQLVFQLFSVIMFCTIVQHGVGLLYYLSGGRTWVMIFSYAVLSAGVIWFLIGFLRPLFLRTMLELRRGWWLMCLMMAMYYVIVIYLIPGYVGSVQSSTILKPAISLLMVGFYSILMLLFSSIQKESETRHNAQLFSLQLSALQSRMEAVRSAEHVIRTERHDLRHRLQTVTELVARGDSNAALQFLDTAKKRLDDQKESRWCRPPVLDAVLSTYFDQARNQGIRVKAKISLPDTISVDEGELATVLANALENAIHANLKMPPEQREIRCKMVGSPSIMLEISNPCDGRVAFDSQGLPLARQEGHGLGVQSISAFCRKYSAVCQFEQIDNRFRLRLVL